MRVIVTKLIEVTLEVEVEDEEEISDIAGACEVTNDQPEVRSLEYETIPNSLTWKVE